MALLFGFAAVVWGLCSFPDVWPSFGAVIVFVLRFQTCGHASIFIVNECRLKRGSSSTGCHVLVRLFFVFVGEQQEE
jgi:hypothetical protein